MLRGRCFHPGPILLNPHHACQEGRAKYTTHGLGPKVRFILSAKKASTSAFYPLPSHVYGPLPRLGPLPEPFVLDQNIACLIDLAFCRSLTFGVCPILSLRPSASCGWIFLPSPYSYAVPLSTWSRGAGAFIQLLTFASVPRHFSPWRFKSRSSRPVGPWNVTFASVKTLTIPPHKFQVLQNRSLNARRARISSDRAQQQHHLASRLPPPPHPERNSAAASPAAQTPPRE
jgi:hypothetical protein